MANFEGDLNLNVETSEIEIKGKFKLTEEELDTVAGGELKPSRFGNPSTSSNEKYESCSKCGSVRITNLDTGEVREDIKDPSCLHDWWAFYSGGGPTEPGVVLR